MSYNIDTWKTKEIKNLVINLDDLYAFSDGPGSRGWIVEQPEILDLPDPLGPALVQIDLPAEDSFIKGWLKGKELTVTEIQLHYEGSGTCYYEVLRPAFKKSKGYLRSKQIWEGGDNITEIVFNDGVITETEVEL